VIALLSGTGLFFGTLFRKTNTAVIANVIFAATIWFLIPLLLHLTGPTHDPRAYALLVNPFHQVAVVMDTASFQNISSTLELGWNSDGFGIFMSLFIITIITCSYILIGVCFMNDAKKRLRKNIFSI
jgi:hypothetical protein